MCSQRSSLMGGYKDFCRQPSISKYCVPRNFVNTFKNYRCSSPAPLSVFFIQQKQRSLRLSCSLWSIDKWSGVMTLISDLVRSQLCMMGECPCSWWAGATLQLDMRLLRLHSLRCFSLLAGCSIGMCQQNIHWCPHTWSIAVIVIMTVCRVQGGRSWAGLGIWRHDMGMTWVWQGYDDTLFPDRRTRTWQHASSSAPQVGGMLTTWGELPRRDAHYWPKLSTVHGHQPQQTTRYVRILRWAVCR